MRLSRSLKETKEWLREREIELRRRRENTSPSIAPDMISCGTRFNRAAKESPAEAGLFWWPHAWVRSLPAHP
jgi:hypothetical protein